MTIKGADWDRRLSRALLAPNGKRLRTLRDAANFVAGERPAALIWLSAAQALLVASLLPDAVEGVTEALEKTIETLAPPKKKSPRQQETGLSGNCAQEGLQDDKALRLQSALVLVRNSCLSFG